MLSQHYIYLHRRLVGNTTTHKRPFDVFYVGQGTDKLGKITLGLNTLVSKARANQTTHGKRSEHWQRTTAKYGRIVEIIKIGLTKSEADYEEKRLIAFYSRACLVNKTDGSEGTAGTLISEETREKLRIATTLRMGRKVICTTTAMTFETATDAANWLLLQGKSKSLKSCQAGIGKVCLGELSAFLGYQFIFADGTTPVAIRAASTAKKRPIRNITTGKSFLSVAEAAEAYNIKRTALSNCLNGHCMTTAGFEWEYIS